MIKKLEPATAETKPTPMASSPSTGPAPAHSTAAASGREGP